MTSLSCHTHTVKCYNFSVGYSKVQLTICIPNCRQLKATITTSAAASTALPVMSATKQSAGAQSERSLMTAGRKSLTHSGTDTSTGKFVPMKNTLHSIWDDHSTRTDTVRSIGRNISFVRSHFTPWLGYSH